MALVIGDNDILITEITPIVETTTFGLLDDEIIKVRKGPGSGYSYIGSHNNGDKWKIAEIYNGWARVPNKDEWTDTTYMTVKTKDEVTPGELRVTKVEKSEVSRSKPSEKKLKLSILLSVKWYTRPNISYTGNEDEYYDWNITMYFKMPDGTKSKNSIFTHSGKSSVSVCNFVITDYDLEETSGNDKLDLEFFIEYKGVGTHRTIEKTMSVGKLTLDITPYDPAEIPECTKINIEDRTDTSVKLIGEYNENFDPIDKYQFRYKKDSDTDWYTMSEITVGNASLSSLTPNTKYLVSSRCHNKMGWGNWIEDVEFFTKPVANKPVTSVKTGQSVTEITCTKNSTNYPDINYYGLKYKLSISSEWIELPGQAINTFPLYNLEYNTSYDFMTRTRTSKGLDGTTAWSDWSDIITVTTPPKLGKTTLACVGNNKPTELDFKIDYDVPFEEVKKYNVKIKITAPNYNYKSISVNGIEVKDGDILQLPKGIYPLEFVKSRFARYCLGNVTANGISVTNLTVIDKDIELIFSLKDYYRWKVNLTVSGKLYEDNRFCGTFNTISGELRHILTPDELDEGWTTGYPGMPNFNSVEFKNDPSGAYDADLGFNTKEDHSGNRFVYIYLCTHLGPIQTATGKNSVDTDITNFTGTISNRYQSEKLTHSYNSTVYDPPKQLWCEYTITQNVISDGVEEYELEDLPIIDLDKKEEAIPKFQLRYKSLTNQNWIELPASTNINQTLKNLTPGETYTIQSRATYNITTNEEPGVVEKYGATWKKVFYHNTNNDTIWFKDNNEALHITDNEYKYSILDELDNYKGSDGKLEFLLEYPTDHPEKYNRWKQTNNPINETQDASGSNVDGYDPIHIDWSNDFNGLALSDSYSPDVTFLEASNTKNSNNISYWYYTIGRYGYTPSNITSWQNKMPGPHIGSVGNTVTEVVLYVKIENPKSTTTTISSQWSQSITVRNVKYPDFKQIRVNKNDSTDTTIKVHVEYLEGYIDINRVYYAAVPITSTVDPGIIPTMFCPASISHQQLENKHLLQPVTIDKDYLGNPLLPNTEYKVYLHLNQYKPEEEWYVKGLDLYKSMSTNAFTKPTVGTLSNVGCTQNNTFDSLKISATKSGTWTIYEGWQLRYKVFTEPDLTYTPWTSIDDIDKIIEGLESGETYQVQVRGSTGVAANRLKYYSDIYSFKIRVAKKPKVNLTITRLKGNEIGVRAVIIDPGYPYISSIDWEYSSNSFISQSYTPLEWKLSSTISFNKEVPPTLLNFVYKDLYHYARYNIRAKLVQQETNLDWYTSGIDYDYNYDINDIELPLYNNRTDRLKGYNKGWKKVSSLNIKDNTNWVDLGTNEEEPKSGIKSNQIWSKLGYNEEEMTTGMWIDGTHYNSEKFTKDYSVWIPGLEPISFEAYNAEDNGYGGKLFKNFYDINFNTLQTTDTNPTKPYLNLGNKFEFVKNKNSLSAKLKDNITDNVTKPVFELCGLDRIVNLNTIKNIYLEYSVDVIPMGSDNNKVGSFICNFWSKEQGSSGLLNEPHYSMNSNIKNKINHKFLVPILVRHALEIDMGYVFYKISAYNDPLGIAEQRFGLKTKGSIINISNFRMYYTNLSDPY